MAAFCRRRTLVTVTLASLIGLAACTSEELKDAAHAGGKIVYDTLKNMNERDRPGH